MSKKKVTLNIDSKVYSVFKEYCEKNAIVLSKRIEIFMLDILKNSKSLKMLLLIPLIILLSFTVSAATIYSDGFESGTLSGWILTSNDGANNWTAIGTDPFQGSFHAQSQPQDTLPVPASVMERIISTSGYRNISITYYRKLVQLDAGGDEFEVEWFNGGSWTSVEINNTDANDATYIARQFNLTSSAENNSNFRIKFECTAGAVSEFCRVDNILIEGNVIDTANPVVNLNVPLNNSFALNTNVSFNGSFTDNVQLKNSTFHLWNSTFSLINTTSLNISGLFNETVLTVTLPYEGKFYWNYLVFDNNGNNAFNNTNFSLTYDATRPLVSLRSPLNISYSSVQTVLNFSASDTNLQSCWYSVDGGVTNTTLTCGTNATSLNSGQGSSTWRVYANDSAGNLNSSSVIFFVDSFTPLINFVSPTPNSGVTLTSSHVIVNVSASDTNLANVTIMLFNATGLIRQNTSANSFSINYSGLPDGTYFFNATTVDILGNSNSTETRNFTIDATAPLLSILSPTNSSYNNATILVNLSSSGASYAWFFNGTGNETYTNPVLRIFSQGNNVLRAYANDSAGNINSSYVNFFVDSISPVVNIAFPANDSTLGDNQSISLNFTAVDTNLQSCWYSLDYIANISLTSCVNSTFNVSNGQHTIRVYANDSLSNLGDSITTFNVQVGSPAITLVGPNNGVYLNHTFIYFNYSATDPTLSSCSLYGNFNGSYALNQTNNTLISGASSWFVLNLRDNPYSWAILCNDSLNNVAVTSNRTITIDTVSPTLSVTEPSGTYSSLSGIPLTFSYSDSSPVDCYYNISFAATGLTVIENTRLATCNSTTFNVDTESSYRVGFFINDSAGNSQYSSSNFTVTLPVGGGPAGGGGGGGGGGHTTVVMDKFELEIEALSKLEIGRGEGEAISVKVKNKGNKFLNTCFMSASEGVSSWISIEQVESLSPGQEVAYIFVVNVPINVDRGEYFTNLNIQCNEANLSQRYEISVIGGEFEIILLSSARQGTKLLVNYAAENFADSLKTISLRYELLDSKKTKVAEGIIDPFEIGAGANLENFFEFELPKNSIGEYSLLVEASDGSETNNYEQLVRLTREGVTGLAISENNLRALSWFGILLLFSLGIYIVIKMIHHQISLKKAGESQGRDFITLDLEESPHNLK